MPRRVSLLAAVPLVLALTFAADAEAATINVTTLADAIGDPGCSLREAVEAANDNTTGPGADCTAGQPSPTVDRIVLPANDSAIELTLTGAKEDAGLTGDLDVESDVLIDGAGQGLSIIDGTGSDRVLDFKSGTSELRDVTVTNGHTPDGAAGGSVPDATPGNGSSGASGESIDGNGPLRGDGGGIRNESTGVLTLRRVTVSGNGTGDGGAGGTAGAGGAGTSGIGGFSSGGDGGSGGNGGGVASEGGGLTIVDSLIELNVAGDGGRGGNGAAGGEGTPGFSGGLSQGGFGGTGGNGGGVYQLGGPVAITRSRISGNFAGRGGQGGNGGAAGDGGDNPGLAGGDGNNSFGGGANFGGFGGGVDVEGGAALTITASTIRGNHAGDGGLGGDGGAGGDGGSGDITGAAGDSEGAGGGLPGFGGGVRSLAQSTSVVRSAIVDNHAGNGARGGDAGTGGAGATPGGNTAGGTGSDGGSAGGLMLGGSGGGDVTNSTIARNSSGHGGGGGAAGTGPGNDVPGQGGDGGSDGGVEIGAGAGAFVLRHDTIVSNHVGAGGSGTPAGDSGTVGGLRTVSPSAPALRSSIVAKNDAAQCGGTITGGAHTVEFPGSGHCAAAPIHAPPLLSPLGPHGGPTPTMLPLAGSPAVDAAGTGPPCPAIDQRGFHRPRGPACDSGAVERSAPAVVTGPASAIKVHSAHVAGSVNPRGRATSYRFQFGRTRSYGRATPFVPVGSGSAPVAASATLTGLAPNTRYHYRIRAQNPDGKTVGADRTFKTKPRPAARPTRVRDRRRSPAAASR